MELWWQHESLVAKEDDLVLDGHSLTELARKHGTPLYVYSRETVRRRLLRMQDFLGKAKSQYKIYYAMKSNRHESVLETVRAVGNVGVDTCSPREVQLAREHGFRPDEISFNAGMLSNSDLDFLAASGVHVTLDSYSSLRRYGQRVKSGTSVGLRFNPGTGTSYGNTPRLLYANAKFGFDIDEAPAAIRFAESAGLNVDTIHMHIGWGLPEQSAPQVDVCFRRLTEIAAMIPELKQINVGGGLGGRYRFGDHPLLLATWSDLIAKHFGAMDVIVACEPGTYISAPAGVLLVEVNTVERRRGIDWVGVNAGFSVNLNPAHYEIFFESVRVASPFAEPMENYTIAGHINEAIDIWVRRMPMPKIQEGDLLAFLPAGAYGSSMASDHCLRGVFKEIAV